MTSQASIRFLGLTLLLAASSLNFFIACSASSEAGSPDRRDGKDAPSPASNPESPASSTSGSSSDTTPCDASSPGAVTETCSAFGERSLCVVDAFGKKSWKKVACAADEACFAGKCSKTQCADECIPGEGGCKLWDMASRSYVAATPQTSLNDRARDYDARLRSTSLLHGQVVNVNYTEESKANVASYSGYRDAAIWTGSALAAESWRLIATRSPDAAARVDTLVRTLHRSFKISGDPGLLARFVVPKTNGGSAPALSPATTCGSNDWHCNVNYEGQAHDYVGGISRDQYTGFILGFTLAYLATADDELKSIIRKDVVEVATELAKQRKGVPIRVVVNGVPLTKEIDIENVILAPSELVNGRVTLDLSTSEVSSSESQGMREFVPDFSMIVKPITGIGTPIPRNSTAIMIGAFFEAALMMSADAPPNDTAMKAQHDALAAYYASKAEGWAKIASAWTFDTRDGCGKGYFSSHIAFIMAYVWSSLVKASPIMSYVKDATFDQAMWGALKGHKNSYFAFLWASTRQNPDGAALESARTQLAQFEAGPRVQVPRNSTAMMEYMPHDTSCTAEPLCDIKTMSVDVKDRRVDDFLWQRQPWQLYDGGDMRRVYPGVDYLAAYWAGRRHGFIQDDRPGTCGRRGP